MKITLENKNTGLRKEVKVGFSWTSLFFGIFVPIGRQDFKGFGFQLVLAMVTFGFSWFVVPFMYNKRYIRRLIEKGYTPMNEQDRRFLRAKNII